MVPQYEFRHLLKLPNVNEEGVAAPQRALGLQSRQHAFPAFVLAADQAVGQKTHVVEGQLVGCQARAEGVIGPATPDRTSRRGRLGVTVTASAKLWLQGAEDQARG
jgi:hypothetical protein